MEYARTFDIVILGVVLIEHSIGDIRNVSTGIALSSNVYFVVLDAEFFLR
jgi:hypothetical protein